MNRDVLAEDRDPMGAALYDYFISGRAARLRVFSPQFDEDEIPVKELFRTYGKMPVLEQTALRLAKGKVLDVGAGSGCHSLALQDMGKTVRAIDISPWAVKVMRGRGVDDVAQANLFDPAFGGRFDTILLLMNGAGIAGKLENLPEFFLRMKQLLAPGGCVVLDSSDLRYLFEDEDGSFAIDLAGDYYGEVDFRMQYRQVKGDRFDWLYIDFDMLSLYASRHGFQAELVQEGGHYDYLARLSCPR